MYRTLSAALTLLALAGCNAWNLPDDNYAWLDAATWDPAVVAAKDGVYVRLPQAGLLVRVDKDGTTTPVDLDGAAPESLLLAPDQETLLVRATWPICTDDDPKIKHLSDCPEDAIETGHEIDLVRDGARVGTLGDVPEQFNRITYSEDGTLGVAYLDFSNSSEVDINGSLNLTQVSFFEMADGTVHNVTVGFAAENVLFTPGDPRAVVLSRSEVAVVDLSTFDVTVTYPLTLDPDLVVVPTDVALTPDGRYAMVSVAGQADLYVLDLSQESIDLVELNGVPSDLLVDAEHDRTIIVYASQSQVDVLDHAYFELTSVDLDEPATNVLGVDGQALLYNGSGSYHDVYLFDVATDTVVEYRAENPVMDMYLTANQAYAVATLNRESSTGSGVSGFYDQYYGLDIFDLTTDRNPTALALEGQPLGLALVEDDTENHALVLVEGLDDVLNIDLFDGSDTPISLTEPPLGITASPEGQFIITESSHAGILAFLDPATNAVTEVAGFALTGILHDDTLPRRGEEN